jgi:hypothetical protein
VTCDAKYLSALQWSTSKITKDPPIEPKSESVIFMNSSNFGYLEISYFNKEYLKDKDLEDV